MKTDIKTLVLVVQMTIVLIIGTNRAFAQITSFTYQGHLNDSGGSANGNYDLRFTVYDALNGGAPVGTSEDVPATVTGGLFTVTLDFGSNVFTGAPRWLELAVRTNGGSSFSALSPRQGLTATPYALLAAAAANLAGTLPVGQLSGTLANNQLANSTITITTGNGLSGGGTVALGGATTLNNTGVLSIAGGADVTVSSSAGSVVLGTTATSSNAANTIVKRDASGSFSAGSITANLSGGAAGLTNLDASQLSSGTIPDARLAPAVARTGQVWLLAGNDGTAAGTQFLGTTDSQPLEIHVNGVRALRIEPTSGQNFLVGAPNVIGGSPTNVVAPGVSGATIGGGGAVGFSRSNIIFGIPPLNTVAADFGTVGGGLGNTASGSSSTVSGGTANTASSFVATVAGGVANSAAGYASTVSGGNSSVASGDYAIVAAGQYNFATGSVSTVSGGNGNIAGGIGSTVSGGYLSIASGSSSSVGGGYYDWALGDNSTVGGGTNNTASGGAATVGGGRINTASGLAATVSGGEDNTASGDYSTVSGGQANTASGLSSAVSGGGYNTAAAAYSFAGGLFAHASHEGSFVWSDYTGGDFSTTGIDQFLIRASGGVGIGATNLAGALTIRGPAAAPPNGMNGVDNPLALGLYATNDYKWIQSYGGPLVLNQWGNNVGIAVTNPAFTLEVNGTAGKPGGGSWSVSSDARLKKNIQQLTGALDRLLALRGVTFEYIDPSSIHELPGERIGLIAQEVEKVFPDWVETGQNGYKRVTVRGLEALVVEALRQVRAEEREFQRDQEVRLEELRTEKDRELDALRARVEKLECLLPR
jgi:hypothetical protein